MVVEERKQGIRKHYQRKRERADALGVEGWEGREEPGESSSGINVSRRIGVSRSRLKVEWSKLGLKRRSLCKRPVSCPAIPQTTKGIKERTRQATDPAQLTYNAVEQ